MGGDGVAQGSSPSRARGGTLSNAAVPCIATTPAARSTLPPTVGVAPAVTPHTVRGSAAAAKAAELFTGGASSRAPSTGTQPWDRTPEETLQSVARRQQERQSRDTQLAERRTHRAMQARKRLAEAEAAAAQPGWSPKVPTPKAGVPRRSGLGGAAPARHPPVERPEELPEAKETTSALRARRRQLNKDIEALGDPSSAGDTFGRQKHARTRLVTIRLVDERLAAEGQTPEHRDVMRLAAAADLRHAEVLTWPGGLRVVFSEEVPPKPTAAGPSGSGQRSVRHREWVAKAERLQADIKELHGQQMGFFLALLDARLGFDTAAGASVQRQAEREHEYHQVPLACASLHGASNSQHFVYPATSQPTRDDTTPQTPAGEVSEEADDFERPATGGSVFSALARVFRESVEDGKREQAMASDLQRGTTPSSHFDA